MMSAASQSQVSPFASGAPQLAGLGFHIVPIDASSKSISLQKWTQFAKTRATDDLIKEWCRRPNANIAAALGSPCGEGLVLVAIDIDLVALDDIERVKSALPATPMRKFGSKGETLFYKALEGTRSRNLKHSETKKNLVEIMCEGRQTVLPPSIHPDTGHRYVWTGSPVPVATLPVLNPDAIERLEDSLEGLGYVRAPDVAITSPLTTHSPSADRDDDEVTIQTIGRRLNNGALDRLDSWVADLGLPKTRRTGLSSWEAIPTWRASNEGRPTMQRKPSLKIHREGIRDMGTDVGYTALDVVMNALGLCQDDAFRWLDSRVQAFEGTYGNENGDPATMEANAARRAEAKLVATAARQASSAGDCVTWDDREANAARKIGWLVKNLFPRVGVSLLWGQSGSGKSFVALDLAASIATGQPFFAHHVKARGGSLFALGEGAGSMPDRLNALRIGRFGSEPPFDPSSGEAIALDRLPIGWMPVGDLAKDASFRVFAEHVRRVAGEMPERHGVPLRLVVVDTVVASFAFPEDPDASAVTGAMKALDALAQELRCLVVAVHHAGKSKQAGEHGSYAWRGSAETSVQVDAERNDTSGAVENRRLFVRKNRHGGNEGWNRPFELTTVQLAIDEDGDPVTSCVVDAKTAQTIEASSMKQRERDFWAAFQATIDIGCGEMVATEAEGEVLAVLAPKVRSQFSAMHPGSEESKRKACERGRKDALLYGRIKTVTLGQSVWLYLPVPQADNDNQADLSAL